MKVGQSPLKLLKLLLGGLEHIKAQGPACSHGDSVATCKSLKWEQVCRCVLVMLLKAIVLVDVR